MLILLVSALVAFWILASVAVFGLLIVDELRHGRSPAELSAELVAARQDCAIGLDEFGCQWPACSTDAGLCRFATPEWQAEHEH